MIKEAVEIARESKRLYPDKPVVIGGWHPSLLPDQSVNKRSKCLKTAPARVSRSWPVLLAIAVVTARPAQQDVRGTATIVALELHDNLAPV